MKLTSIILSISLVTANLAFGLGLNQPSPVEIPSESECANFAGNWIGTCSEISNGEALPTEEDQMLVKQIGCARLTLSYDGTSQEFSIDGINQQTSTSSDFWEQTTSTISWDATKRNLSGELKLSQRSFKPAISTESTGEFKISHLDQDRLVVQLEGRGVIVAPESAGGRNEFTYKSNCEYRKQN
jgi:hypothetical protein